MKLPVTTAVGNLVVGALAGTASAVAADIAEDHGVGTMGQLGVSLGVSLPFVFATRGHLLPYMGGAIGASLGVSALMDAMEK